MTGFTSFDARRSAVTLAPGTIGMLVNVRTVPQHKKFDVDIFELIVHERKLMFVRQLTSNACNDKVDNPLIDMMSVILVEIERE